MDPSDKPHPFPADAGAARPTYADVVAGRHLQREEVAAALAQVHGDVGWGDTWEVTATAGEDVENGAEHLKRMIGATADELTPQYFLVVIGRKVEVVYGYRACRALDGGGRRFAGLVGERVSQGGVALQPKLCVTEPTEERRQYQCQAFSRIGARTYYVGCCGDLTIYSNGDGFPGVFDPTTNV